MAAPIALKNINLVWSPFTILQVFDVLVTVYIRIGAHDLTSCLLFLRNHKANIMLPQIQAFCIA